MTSSLTPADLRDLHQTYRDGMDTLAGWRAEAPVTITRKATTGIVSTIASFTPIKIALDDTQPQQAVSGALVNTVRTGSMKLRLADLGGVQLNQGDKFTWQGQFCTVAEPPVTKYGEFVDVAFTTAARNRGV